MVGPCPAVSFLPPKLKPLKSTAPRVDAPARRLLKLPEFNWGQIPIVFVWFVLFALWERRPRRDEALQTTTHRPGGGAPTFCRSDALVAMKPRRPPPIAPGAGLLQTVSSGLRCPFFQ
jgi:hypothetical protein